jgi:hypothetical protein
MPIAKKNEPVAPEPKARRAPLSPEHRENIRQAMLGKKHTPETRQKLKDAAARRRARGWNTKAPERG